MISMLIGRCCEYDFRPCFYFCPEYGYDRCALATNYRTDNFILYQPALYVFILKQYRLTKDSFHVTGKHCRNIFMLGASACFNQIAMTVVQIVMNNTLAHYGAQSVYGR